MRIGLAALRWRAALGVGLALRPLERLSGAVLGIQPIVATLILMVAGRGIAQLITEGQIVTFYHARPVFLGTGILLRPAVRRS